MNELNINDHALQYMSEDSIDWLEDIFYYLKIGENKNSDQIIEFLEGDFNSKSKRFNLSGQEYTFLDSLVVQYSYLNGYLDNFHIAEKLGKRFKRRKVERHEFVSFINDDFNIFLESLKIDDINNEELLMMYIKAIKDNRLVYINDNHIISNRDIEKYFPFMYCDSNKEGYIEIRLCNNVFRKLHLIRNSINKKIDNFQTTDKSIKKVEEFTIEDKFNVLEEFGLRTNIKNKGYTITQTNEILAIILGVETRTIRNYDKRRTGQNHTSKNNVTDLLYKIKKTPSVNK